MEKGRMISLELSASDAGVLAEALESYLSDLRMEIADTDSKDFRDGLKARKEVLVRALEALRR